MARYFKDEFRRRLERLSLAIDHALTTDASGEASFYAPRLFSVLSYLWFKSEKDLYKYGK